MTNVRIARHPNRGGGDRTYYKCGEKGHISQDCPKKGVGGGDGGGGGREHGGRGGGRAGGRGRGGGRY